jgi:hypothetical protein
MPDSTIEMVAALAQIEQTGLSLQQIKNVGGGLLSYLEDANRVCASISPDTVCSADVDHSFRSSLS